MLPTTVSLKQADLSPIPNLSFLSVVVFSGQQKNYLSTSYITAVKCPVTVSSSLNAGLA